MLAFISVLDWNPQMLLSVFCVCHYHFEKIGFQIEFQIEFIFDAMKHRNKWIMCLISNFYICIMLKTIEGEGHFINTNEM